MDKPVLDLTALHGGKGASLALLKRQAHVPPFATAGVNLFTAFLRANGIEEVYRRYWEAVLEGGSVEVLDRVRWNLMRAIVLAPWPPEIEQALLEIYGRVGGAVKVARSSASVEDGPHRSWAGQFRTVFGIARPEQWLEAVRECWAEVATPGVAGYGRAAGAEAPHMAVVLQQAVDAMAAGVVFAADPAGGGPGDPVVEATWGLGGPLVAGAVTPERWRRSGPDGRPARVQARRRGPVWLLAAGRDPAPSASHRLALAGGPLEVRVMGAAPVSGVLVGEAIVPPDAPPPVLSEQQAGAILAFVAERAAGGRLVELEWAIDAAGQLWWLQERPITALGGGGAPARTGLSRVAAPARTAPPALSGALMSGVCGSAGVASGPGWWTEEPRPDGLGRPILFTPTTTPADVPVLVKVAGLVTQDGGVLSHSAVVARELGIPCLVAASPFPPDVAVRGPVELDAAAGEVRPGAGAAAPSPPDPVVILSTPGPVALDPPVRWWLGEDLAARIPDPVKRQVERVAALPGVLGPVEVLPDLKEPHPDLGFPIGIAFRSERFHPTAVSDCGDGFRLCAVHGVRPRDLQARAGQVVPALRRWLGEESPGGAAARAEVPLLATFSRGLEALAGTCWQERHPQRVE
ncbi:MAG TPA: PEP/pyruvate-binding domain-containing protein, partial [Symbiobacteriaceae bacterium]|nr:PEP/pyruvate-binding domain-containing protein [Symbiobacteriaceae bacterium]